MDYKNSLKQKISEKIEKLIHLQEIDMEIIKTITLKQSSIREWEELYSSSQSLSKNFEKTKKSINDLNTAIDNKHAEMDLISENIKDISKKQSESKRVEEYNIYQQKIVEDKKNYREIENILDDLQNKKQNLEETMESLSVNIKSFCDDFTIRSNSIRESIKHLNKQGRDLLITRVEKYETAKELDSKLLDRYQVLIKNKSDRAVVPIDGQVCNGCNILLTNNDIGVVKRGLSINYCEHCSRILYSVDQKQDEVITPRKRNRKVFTQSPTDI
ncbi:MAG: hypothetical protein KAH32_02880 [Chlamydiia bacterium]|nr:hypothetical protein [Chlamydiia bacterium]